MPPRPKQNRLREKLHIDAGLSGKIWRHQAGPHFRPLAPHIHDELELNLCVKGDASYLSGGAQIKLQPGRLLWLFPEQDHALHRATADFIMWIAVFRPSVVRRTCKQPENQPLCERQCPGGAPAWVQLAPTASRQLEQSLAAARDCQENDAKDRFNALLPLALLDAWEHTRTAHKQAPAADALHPAVYQAAMRLHEDPSEESLSELSYAAGLSPEHLSRLFRQQMGQTMRAYRSEQRLRRFAQLCASDRWNMTEAALEAGFGSYAQCYRACQERWGVRPSALKSGNA